MYLNSKQIKIAKRIFLAYSYRSTVKTTGFNKYAEKGIVIFNYHFYPIFIVQNNGNGTFTAFKTKNEQSVFDNFFTRPLNLEVQNYIYDGLSRYTCNLRNFRIGLFNYIVSNKAPDKDWSFLISSEENMSYDEIKNILTSEYDIKLSDVNKIADIQNQSSEIKIENMIFRSTEPMDENRLKRLFNEIKSMISGSVLSSLLYGVVEIKNSFQNNFIGDYTDSNDIIRTGGQDEAFKKTFIHELGHRWWHKSMSSQQKKQFKKLYDNCNGKHIVLNKGDVITFYDSDKKFIYEGKYLGSLDFKAPDGENYLYKLIATRSMDTLNGQKIEKYRFPSRYSRTKFSQFIPECIRFVYCNLFMDEGLKAKVKEIIG